MSGCRATCRSARNRDPYHTFGASASELSKASHFSRWRLAGEFKIAIPTSLSAHQLRSWRMHHAFVADELDLVHSVTVSASRFLRDAASSETLPSASTRSQMLSVCPRRSHGVPYASRRSYAHPNTPSRSQKCSQASPHGATSSSTLSVVPIGSHIFSNAPMLS